ncbi:unnamed protein product [Toxocara canis]|uniref:Gal_mutarotas_2 domain-containing protein n=1 Tax=Toxocara canis TaxID=6265 RepID=A0A183USU0_TOXCA|nr:unnamed protein product [Toxocara canis]
MLSAFCIFSAKCALRLFGEDGAEDSGEVVRLGSRARALCPLGGPQRHRQQQNKAEYSVVADSVKSNGTAVMATLESTINKLKLTIVSLDDSTLRFSSSQIESKWAIFITKCGSKLLLNYKPFRIDVLVKDEIVVSINSANKLMYEHFRKKDEGTEKEAGEGFWDETFKTFHDSKPYGSSSVGMDISFIGYKYTYGLPEHGSSFALRTTTLPGMDPYRLYNMDVFEYELNTEMGLYGSVPYVAAVNKNRAIGMLWLNAAETWVDVNSSTADKVNSQFR